MGRQTRRSKQAGLHSGLGEQHKRPQEFLTTNASTGGIQAVQQDSPLLSLPPEIRNRIYQLALGGRKIHVSAPANKESRSQLWFCRAKVSDAETANTIRSASSTTTGLKSFDDNHKGCRPSYLSHVARDFIAGRLPLALLSTCRQVYEEAAAIPFSGNTFIFPSCQALDGLMPWLSEDQKASLSSVIFSSDSRYDPISLVAGIQRLPGLRTMVLFMDTRGWHYGTGVEALKETLLRVAGRISHACLNSITTCAFATQVHWPPGYSGPPTVTIAADPAVFGSFCDELERLLKAT